jgi:hypothetical protein
VDADEDGGPPGAPVPAAVPVTVKRDKVVKATRTQAPPAATGAGECK